MASWFFLIILLGLYTFACCVLIFVILIQSGKGGGLSSLGSASSGLTEALGATGAEKTLNRLTTWCAAGFMILAVIISLYATHMMPQGGTRTLLGNPAQTQGAPQAPLGANPGRTAPAGQPSAPGAAVPAAPGAAPAASAPVAPAQQAPVAPPAAQPQAPTSPAAPAPAK